ncbi:MAG TPA: rod-binding protein [Clostridia bacterium]|nr:rod-binding protein [Clostridia bacterium]
MEISAFQRHVKAADLPLDKLAGNTQVSESDKVTEVSRQFEAVLLRHILSEANKPVFTSKFNQESSSTGIYRDLLVNQMADTISHSKALGLGDSLSSQMAHELKVEGGTKP